LLEHELIEVEEMITDRFKLADAPQAFARAAERGAMKVLLTGPGE
jgi:threonine dehydrogenase-like Zn-dependent dehydrogenase